MTEGVSGKAHALCCILDLPFFTKRLPIVKIYKVLTWVLTAMWWEMCNFVELLILGMVYIPSDANPWNGKKIILRH